MLLAHISSHTVFVIVLISVPGVMVVWVNVLYFYHCRYPVCNYAVYRLLVLKSLVQKKIEID